MCVCVCVCACVCGAKDFSLLDALFGDLVRFTPLSSSRKIFCIKRKELRFFVPNFVGTSRAILQQRTRLGVKEELGNLFRCCQLRT